MILVYVDDDLSIVDDMNDVGMILGRLVENWVQN